MINKACIGHGVLHHTRDRILVDTESNTSQIISILLGAAAEMLLTPLMPLSPMEGLSGFMPLIKEVAAQIKLVEVLVLRR